MRDLPHGCRHSFITHKLREVLAIADDIVVLRNGEVVGRTTPSGTSETALAEMMVGRSVLLRVDKTISQPGEVVLEVRNLEVDDDRSQRAVNNLSLKVREGEILGIAGVEGNGQRELVEAVTGLRPSEAGEILISTQAVMNTTPRKIASLGVGHIPEDREKHGVIGIYSVEQNAMINRYHRKPFSFRGLLQRSAITSHAKEVVDEFDVRTPRLDTAVATLSGGNKQKLIVGREFSGEIKFLIAAQPTRGIDIGAIEFIHKSIIRKRDEGAAVLLVSAELDEIIGLADRIAVLFEGKIVATLDAAEADREQIGLLMAGVGVS